MSVHGNQYLLPLFLRKDGILPPIKGEAGLALAYYLLTKDLKEGEKILSFSRLLWPFLSIQGIISTHIILDGLKLFSKKGKLSNPPRQALIGHILRNVDNRGDIDQLNRIIEVLSYKDSEAEEIGESEESEYRTLQIEGLINPEFLQTLKGLMPQLENMPITGYMPLDTTLSTEQALNLSEKFRNIITDMKGNSLRWKSVSELIEKNIEKWITELNVQLKDLDSRYSSILGKTASKIDSGQIKEKMEKLQDNIEQWKVSEKKKVIENILSLFKSIERTLEETLKRNKFFCISDTLKSKNIEDIQPDFENHFDFLREKGKGFLDLIESTYQEYLEYIAGSTQIDIEAENKLEKRAVDLNIKLIDRDKQLSEVEREKQEKIIKLENHKNQIESLFKQITDILQVKRSNCLQEAKDLEKWALEDTEAEFFSKPIQWMYLPLYAVFIEDEDMMEERMKIVFPGYVTKDSIYKEVSDVFIELQSFLNEKIEDDMKIRSNFEFSCENNNLLKVPIIVKKIQKGISILRNLKLLDEQKESEFRESLKLIQ